MSFYQNKNYDYQFDGEGLNYLTDTHKAKLQTGLGNYYNTLRSMVENGEAETIAQAKKLYGKNLKSKPKEKKARGNKNALQAYHAHIKDMVARGEAENIAEARKLYKGIKKRFPKNDIKYKDNEEEPENIEKQIVVHHPKPVETPSNIIVHHPANEASDKLKTVVEMDTILLLQLIKQLYHKTISNYGKTLLLEYGESVKNDLKNFLNVEQQENFIIYVAKKNQIRITEKMKLNYKKWLKPSKYSGGSFLNVNWDKVWDDVKSVAGPVIDVGEKVLPFVLPFL